MNLAEVGTQPEIPMLYFILKVGLDHNCGHILLRVVSKPRPLPAYDMARSGEAGNGRDGPHDVMAAVMIKP